MFKKSKTVKRGFRITINEELLKNKEFEAEKFFRKEFPDLEMTEK